MPTVSNRPAPLLLPSTGSAVVGYGNPNGLVGPATLSGGWQYPLATVEYPVHHKNDSGTLTRELATAKIAKTIYVRCVPGAAESGSGTIDDPAINPVSLYYQLRCENWLAACAGLKILFKISGVVEDTAVFGLTGVIYDFAEAEISPGARPSFSGSTVLNIHSASGANFEYCTAAFCDFSSSGRSVITATGSVIDSCTVVTSTTGGSRTEWLDIQYSTLWGCNFSGTSDGGGIEAEIDYCVAAKCDFSATINSKDSGSFALLTGNESIFADCTGVLSVTISGEESWGYASSFVFSNSAFSKCSGRVSISATEGTGCGFRGSNNAFVDCTAVNVCFGGLEEYEECEECAL